jgi:hypothetical protein
MHNIRMTPTPDPTERSSTRCGPRVWSGLTSVLTKVQAKRWSHSVPGRIVRELRGALRVDEHGLIVTTAEFTPEAIREAAAQGKARIGRPRRRTGPDVRRTRHRRRPQAGSSPRTDTRRLETSIAFGGAPVGAAGRRFSRTAVVSAEQNPVCASAPGPITDVIAHSKL